MKWLNVASCMYTSKCLRLKKVYTTLQTISPSTSACFDLSSSCKVCVSGVFRVCVVMCVAECAGMCVCTQGIGFCVPNVRVFFLYEHFGGAEQKSQVKTRQVILDSS